MALVRGERGQKNAGARMLTPAKGFGEWGFSDWAPYSDVANGAGVWAWGVGAGEGLPANRG